MPALLLAAMLQFTLAFCFGLLAFWFLEIQGFVILSFAAETLLSGQIFPLDLLPPSLFHAAQLLPFYYMMYFPAAILTGRIDLQRRAARLRRPGRVGPVVRMAAGSSGSRACASTPPSAAEPIPNTGYRRADTGSSVSTTLRTNLPLESFPLSCIRHPPS